MAPWEPHVNHELMAQFMEACGATAPLQLIVDKVGEPEGVRHVINQPFAMIGRDPRVDLILDDLRVSRRHAYLQMLAGQAFCLDLGSRTGTRRKAGRKLPDGSEALQYIRIGPFRIRRGETAPLPPPRADLPDPPEVTLEFLNQAPAPTHWEMHRALELIGRSEQCKVRLLDTSVSKFHCSLLRTPLGVWVVDLYAREGVFVNGTRVRLAKVDDGDELKVGKFLVRVHYQREAASTGRVTHLALGDAADLPPDDEADDEAENRTALDADPGPFPTSLLQELSAAADGILLPVESQALPVPRSGQQTDFVETALLPVLNQFGMMQQQMFDQFNQSMAMVLKMFGTMHRDQMGVIREEMDRLNELTRELNTLQAELAKDKTRPQAKPGSPPRPAVSHPNGGATGPAAKPATPPTAPTPVHRSAPPAGTAPPSSPPAPTPAGAQSGQDVHLWLTERIATLQQERQSRWQKVLGFLVGKGTPEEPNIS